MKKLVQCVPNYSEGKDLEIIEKIAAPFKNNKNIKFMGCEPDKDYNRTVITVIGEPEDVIEAVVQSVGIAAELIDMRVQKGEHLRMGATDVIPFIPIKNITMLECVEISKIVAQKISENFNIPTFLYEESATAQNRYSLPSIRKGEFEGMAEKLKLDEWKPDFGERIPHLTAGVTAVGGRMPLIAYNINLDTTNINIAKEISK
ncbi:MAG: glutamate formimidoyltransferase, partial [Cetobacterium sp.]